MPRWSAKLLSKALLDDLFVVSEFASGSVLSLRDDAGTLREIEAGDALYRAKGWTKNPKRFHQPVSPLRVEDIRDVRSRSGVHQHLRFESGYEPHAEEPGRDRWRSYRANTTGHAWLLEHPGPPRPWVSPA